MLVPLFVLVLVWPYLAFLSGNNIGLIVYSILTLVLFSFFLCKCIFEKSPDYGRDFAFWNLLIKLVQLPGRVFLLLSCVWFSLWTFGFKLVGINMPIVFGIAYALLFVISIVPGLKALSAAHKQKIISTRYFILHSILQYIFIVNVFSSIAVYRMLRKSATDDKT